MSPKHPEEGEKHTISGLEGCLPEATSQQQRRLGGGSAPELPFPTAKHTSRPRGLACKALFPSEWLPGSQT